MPTELTCPGLSSALSEAGTAVEPIAGNLTESGAIPANQA